MENTIRLEILDSVTSTMDVARENVTSGRHFFTPEGSPLYQGVMAYEQTLGRGQRGNRWFAAPRQSLCATFYYRDSHTDPEHSHEVSLLAGVAVLSAVQQVIGRAVAIPQLGLKWPNDLLLNGKKLGGILIEMVKAEDGKWVILIGTGINLTVPTFPPELASIATSLVNEGLPSCTCEEMAEQIAHQLTRFAQRKAEQGFAYIHEIWQSYDLTQGRRYLFEEAGVSRIGTAVGVTPKGSLRLQCEDGSEIVVKTATSLKELL